MSPLLAQSRHFATEFRCPLLGVKRTSVVPSPMSASDPKRTLAEAFPNVGSSRYDALFCAAGEAMRRREFITLVSVAATTWPLVARGQQGDRIRRIAVLMAYAESDSEAQAWVAAFRESLQKLGWMEGRHIEINVRW